MVFMMSGPELTKHPRWPLYRKVRRHACQRLRAEGKACADTDIDTYLAAELHSIAEDLLQLYMHDISARGARDRVLKFINHHGGKPAAA